MESDFGGVEYQLVTINYINSAGRRRKYTTDALVFFKDSLNQKTRRKPILIAVKYREELEKDLISFIERFCQARTYTREQGWHFRIVTERKIRTERFHNSSSLYPYKDRKVGTQLHHSIVQYMHKDIATTSKQIVNAISTSPTANASRIVGLWYLVANGEFSMNLNAPISMNSLVRITR